MLARPASGDVDVDVEGVDVGTGAGGVIKGDVDGCCRGVSLVEETARTTRFAVPVSTGSSSVVSSERFFGLPCALRAIDTACLSDMLGSVCNSVLTRVPMCGKRLSHHVSTSFISSVMPAVVAS